MKELVRYSCGHIEPMTIPVDVREREAKIKWAQSEGLCMECYRLAHFPKCSMSAVPAIVRGHSWDGYVYEDVELTDERYIYVDGTRIYINKETAKELETYAAAVRSGFWKERSI